MRPGKAPLVCALLLTQVLSLSTIWSTYPELFLTQLSFVVAGVIIILLLSKVDLSLLFSLSNVFYFVSLLLLLVTLFIGRNIRGSVRWIDLGFFSLQTSEIVKPLLAIFYASYLSKLKQINWSDLFIFFFVALLPVVLIALQPDLGSALTLFFLPVALLVASGQLSKLLLVGLVFLTVMVPLESRLLKPYQRQRLQTFVNPYQDPQGAGYNVIQSTIAVGSGRFLGKGVKLGTQSHLNFLPERHTDFIFASFAEEFGLLGSLVLFAAYSVIFSHSLQNMRRLKERRQILLSLSIFLIFFFQFVVNVGMNLGIMPVTGITLPLFSYGGSSLISFAILAGLQLRQLDLIASFEV